MSSPRRQSEYLASLHETALAVMGDLELASLLEALVDRATTLLGAVNGFLYLENPDASALECRVSVGSRPVDRHALPNEGAVGGAWQGGQPVVVEDYDTWEGRSPQVPRGVFGAMVAVPLRSRGRVVGALGLAHDSGSGRRFPEPDVDLLAGFAQLASIALDNARLYAAAHEQLAERERAQGALLKSEERYRGLVQDSLGLLCTHDLDGVLLLVNAAAADALGYSVAEMVGRSLRDFMPSPVQPALDRYLQTVRREGRAEGVLHIVSRGGDERLWRYRNVLRQESGEAPYVIGFALDETERIRADLALRQSEERFRQLADNIDAVFWMRSLDPTRILYVSPAYERIWGRPREDLYQNAAALLDTVHPEDREVLARRIRERADEYDVEYRIVRPDGAIRWIHSRAFPVHVPGEQVGRIAGIAEDMTARKQLEQLRDDLTHTVVHDLKNPLTVVLGTLESLGGSLDGVLSSDQKRVLEIAQKNGDALQALVETILDVSRLEAGAMPVERQRVSLAALAREVVQRAAPLADAKHLRIESAAVPEGLDASADRVLVGRVLQNLIGNAIKFTPQGGAVRVSARRADSEPGCLRVSVSDTGPGVRAELRDRLFQKFASGRQADGGSGLGLLFCRLAVEAQGGRIWAESAPPGGSTFSFTLPVWPPA